MQMYYHYFPVLSLISGLAMVSLGVFSLFRKNLSGTNLFTILMFIGAEIAVFYFFELACVLLQWKLLFLKIQFFGMATISVVWLLMAAHFCGFQSIISMKYIAILLIIPFITIILAWTNQFHFMIWRHIEIKTAAGVIYMEAVPGYWSWVYLCYTYGTFIIGSAFLIRHAVRTKGLHRSQSIAFLIAAIFPFSFNVVFSFDVFNIVAFDWAPVSFAVSGIALWWAIFKYNLLGIMPAAKDMVLENMRAGIVVTDLKNQVIEVNSFICRLFSQSASYLVGKQVDTIWTGLVHAKPGEEISYKGQGGEYYLEVDKTPVKNTRGDISGTLYLVFDVTEKKKAGFALKKAEEILFESQKIEALGRLADGIAHEFNNILTIVYNYSIYGLSGREEEEQQYQENRRQIQHAIRRGQELTKQLLMFSKKHIAHKDYISVDSVIINMKEVLDNLVKQNIALVYEETGPSGIIFCNQHQVEQIILNLVKNGDDAMPEGGTLTISRGKIYIGEHHFPGHDDITASMYSFIRVKDTGLGITKEIRERIFEPFFTTKDIGAGVGLGLSAVYGTVKQNKGHIEFESTPGKGTVFSVYLPVVSAT